MRLAATIALLLLTSPSLPAAGSDTFLDRPVPLLERLADVGPCVGRSDGKPAYLTVERCHHGSEYAYRVTAGLDYRPSSIYVDPARSAELHVWQTDQIARQSERRLTLDSRGDAETMGARFDFRFDGEGRLSRAEFQSKSPWMVPLYPTIEAEFPPVPEAATDADAERTPITEPIPALQALAAAGTLTGRSLLRNLYLTVSEDCSGVDGLSRYEYHIRLAAVEEPTSPTDYLKTDVCGRAFRAAHVLKVDPRVVEVRLVSSLLGRSHRMRFEFDENSTLTTVTAYPTNIVGLPSLPVTARFGDAARQHLFERVHRNAE